MSNDLLCSIFAMVEVKPKINVAQFSATVSDELVILSRTSFASAIDFLSYLLSSSSFSRITSKQSKFKFKSVKKLLQSNSVVGISTHLVSEKVPTF